MVLGIDVGNTSIVLGCIEGSKICFTERLSTDIKKTDLEYAVLIKTILEIHGAESGDIKGCIISSVVPPLTQILKTAINKLLKISALIVGAGLKTGLNIRLDDPASMGADLVVDSVAGMAEYGAPLIIVDMGTATTITVLDKNSDYIGGAILPGVQVSLESLVSGTSLLPRVSFDAPKKVISSNTLDSVKSGIIYGQASQIDGMIDRFEAELGYNAALVATGGLAQVIIPLCKHEIIIDNDLMLKGLKILYDKNSNR